MTEHVQLEIITSITLIVTTLTTLWRAEVAARRAEAANIAAVQATRAAVEISDQATIQSEKQSKAIEQVHNAVNGGLAQAKAEVKELKTELIIAKLSPAEVPLQPLAPDTETRLEQLRGQQ